MQDVDALAGFSEPSARWFRRVFAEPTRAQREAWASIQTGSHTLVVAPTGSGKTLAAFLWAIDRLMARDDSDGHGAAERSDASTDSAAGKRGTSILYISPLKALGVDVERNLTAPLVGIAQQRLAMGLPVRDITVGVRSGDTPPAERRAQVSTPPDILITTPESLYLLLTSNARSMLRQVQTVIVDEVHAVAATKRGTHLALSLERLDALLSTPVQRIGLSATVRPLDAVATFLGGAAPVTVVAPPSHKAFDLRVVVPVPDLNAIAPVHRDETESVEGTIFGDATQAIANEGADDTRPGSVWPYIESQIVDRVLEHRSTIVFVNSRGLAERLTARLNEEYERRLYAERVASGEADDEPAAAVDGPRRRLKNADLIGGSGEFAGAAIDLARAHHGSVSKEQRAEVEDALKQGRLRCVVATSSLELGIDMGDVELVIQIEAAPSVASGLQRIGRAGHQVGAVSRAVCFPKHRADVLRSAVVAQRMLAGNIERITPISQPLDVLAQHTVSAAAMDRWQVDDWLACVRRASSFSGLSAALLESVLDLLAGKYPSDAFASLRPRIVWNRDADWFEGRPGAQRLAVVSGGTIPDRGLFGVFMTTGTEPGNPEAADGSDASSPTARRTGGLRVGELDEEMVYESRVGDVIALGATSWRIREIGPDRVQVAPAFGEPGRLPFWTGDALGRPIELGEAIGACVREIAAKLAHPVTDPRAALPQSVSAVVDDWAADNLVGYVREQLEVTGHAPHDRQIVIERVRDELGDWRVILHSPFGRPVHAPWALLVTARVRERYGMEGSAVASDDGIVVRIPDIEAEVPGAELFAFEPDEITAQVTREVGSSALFASRFRENAARALLLPRLHPGKRAPLWQQRLRASQLLEVARQHPDFPMILETVREVLHDVYDLDSLRALLAKIAAREVRVVEVTTESPSPFAQTLLFGYVGEFMYEGDQPLAERRAAALQMDANLLADLLGTTSLRELLDGEVIAALERELQHLAPDRRVRGAEGVSDLLRLVGPLTITEIAERMLPQGEPSTPNPSELADEDAAAPVDTPAASTAEARAAADELVTARRAFFVRVAGAERLVAAEDVVRLRDALGVPPPAGVPASLLEPVADPLGDLVHRYARTHGPFSADAMADHLGVGLAVATDALQRAELARTIQRGEFRPSGTGVEWVDTGVLRRIRTRTLAKLRGEIAPVSQRALARFLPKWQQVSPMGTAAPRAEQGPDVPALVGVDGVLAVIEQLQGVALPASAWESLVLPARVRDYSPALLDQLLAAGDVRWRGHGAIGGSDGWISLYLRDLAPLTLPLSPTVPLTECTGIAQSVYRVLQHGAAFVPECLDRLDAERTALVTESEPGDTPSTPEQQPAVAAVPTALEVTNALWELAWAGLVTNDTLTGLRARLTGGAGARSKSAHRSAPRPSRGRMWRSQLITPATTTAAVPPAGAGRWSIAEPGASDPTLRAQVTGELLLERYGVVTRGDAGDIDGGFAHVYRVLSEFEAAGHARRGYFVTELGAAQFATAGAIDRLRALHRDDEHDPTDESLAPALTLAATDPANPFGAALAWPDSIADDASHRPGRKAGALVTLVDGELVSYIERGGKTMLTFTDDETALRAAARSLADTITAAHIPNLVIERCNGTFVLGTDMATWLREAGFVESPRGLRLRP